jgi:L-glyceraldehyde 3-phosphate reductase
VSRVEQLEENVAALDRLDFSDDELAEIDLSATDAGIDIWQRSRLS